MSKAVRSDAPFLIRNHDRVVFWGDSITDNSFWCRSVENFVHSRFPSWDVDFTNLGWGGDTAQTGVERIKRDLPLVQRPTLVLIKLGMNDGAYRAFDSTLCRAYTDGLEQMVAFIRKTTTARIVFITTVPFETGIRKDAEGIVLNRCYVKTLRQFSQRAMALAARLKCGVIDLNKLYAQEIARYKRNDASIAFSDDGVHPGPDGNALMACLLLKAMGAPGLVADLTVDMSAGKTTASVNIAVTACRKTASGVTLTRRPLSFPAVINGRSQVSIDLARWEKELNCNRLRCTGMKLPYLHLIAQGRVIAVYKRSQVEKGVSLDNTLLPEGETAAFINELVDQKHASRYRRWRNLLLYGSPDDRHRPFRRPPPQAAFLDDLAALHQRFLRSGALRCDPYTLELVESASGNPFATAPFTVRAPYPLPEEVQILIEVDTSPWKRIISPRTGTLLQFNPALMIKGDFTGWQLRPMTVAKKTGVWSLALNMPRMATPRAFAFDDGSQERGVHESEVTELIKLGMHDLCGPCAGSNFALVPDTHKVIRITAEHFTAAVAKKRIRVRPA